MNISLLGWRDSFQKSLDTESDIELGPARVFRQDKQRYQVHDGRTIRSATILGKLLYDSPDTSALPAVGDWVEIQPFDDEAIIHSVLPRFSAFFRKESGKLTRQQVIAANIDTVFLVSGLDNDFNIRRIERYMVQAAASGAQPVIVLNKVDLCPDLDSILKEVERIAPGITVVTMSATEDADVNGLRPFTGNGKTVAFLGSSGVGKSSLVNRLLGEEAFKTGSVREDDSRGRHTTSHRELSFIPGGGLVIDTPGLRELQLWGSEDDLSIVFSDIENLGQHCKFNDCQHGGEPGCAVAEALESGTLDEDRYDSYLKLRKELAYLETRQSEVASLSAKKRDKDFGKMVKAMKKNNPKY